MRGASIQRTIRAGAATVMAAAVMALIGAVAGCANASLGFGVGGSHAGVGVSVGPCGQVGVSGGVGSGGSHGGVGVGVSAPMGESADAPPGTNCRRDTPENQP